MADRDRPDAPDPLDWSDEGDVETKSRRSRGGEYRDPDEENTEPPAGRAASQFDEETDVPAHWRDREDGTEPPEPPQQLLGWLVVKRGRRRGIILPVKPGSFIGRRRDRQVGVVLDDPKVSDFHARIRIDNGQFVIWDAGSAHGIYVNGKKVSQATALKENDALQFGDTIVVLKTLEPEPPVVSAD